MLITTIPKDNLVKVCGQWKQGDSLQKLISGQLYGSIDYVDLDDADYPMLITSTSIVLEDCALMIWIAQQLSDSTAIGLLWSADHNSGIIVLHKGAFTEFSISADALMNLQKHLFLEQTDEDELKALQEKCKTEDEIDDMICQYSDEYRVEVRDGLQLEFLKSIYEGNSNLIDYPYFKALSKLGVNWEINNLSTMTSNAKQLLQHINFDDPEFIDSIFNAKDGEFWKQHRDRIHGILTHMPDHLKNNKNLFKKIIPLVAAWPLEYAGSNVRSDKNILRLAIKADKTHGYGASALKYADSKVFDDLTFIKEILNDQPSEFYNLPEKLKSDRDLLKIVLKEGLLFPPEKGGDRELLELFVSSGNSFVYNRIPDEVHQDIKLAKLYLENGGEWFAVPETLRAKRALVDHYIANYNFINDSYSDYKLKKSLEDYLKLDSWDSSSLDIKFVDACLDANTQFSRILRYEHLTIKDWLTIVKKHDVVEHACESLKLRLALNLKKEFNYSQLFDELNDLAGFNEDDPKIIKQLEDVCLKIMETKLAILEGSPEALKQIKKSIK
jgi:hypothetical protein